jgi:hypothetical protein
MTIDIETLRVIADLTARVCEVRVDDMACSERSNAPAVFEGLLMAFVKAHTYAAHYPGDHQNLIDDAIERLDRMTRERDLWRKLAEAAQQREGVLLAERNRWKLAAQAAGVTGDDRFVHSGE